MQIPDSVEALFARDDAAKAAKAAEPAPSAGVSLAKIERRNRKRAHALTHTLLAAGHTAYEAWLAKDVAERRDGPAGTVLASAVYGHSLLEAFASATASVLAANVMGMQGVVDENGVTRPATHEDREKFAQMLLVPVILSITNAVRAAIDKGDELADPDTDDED